MGGLWGLLTLITIRKCADRARYYQADCRDLREAGAGGAPTALLLARGCGANRHPMKPLCWSKRLQVCFNNSTVTSGPLWS